jgi:hypothetical protein
VAWTFGLSRSAGQDGVEHFQGLSCLALVIAATSRARAWARCSLCRAVYPRPVNPETIDTEYAKLEQEADQVAQAIADLSQKMQAAAAAGDANAKEWLLGLKSIALQVQQEQLQAQALLQALHDFTVSNLSQAQGYAAQPAYAPQPAYAFQQPGSGGVLSRLLGGGFGRAIVTGAAFGIGDDLINKIL